MSSAASPTRWQVVLAFALVYVFWGSTYLGIGIAVEHIPPALMCGARFLTAGVFMLGYCGITGRRIRYSARDFGHMAAVGILLLMGGNLTLSYAVRIVPTGLAALLVAVSPLWFLCTRRCSPPPAGRIRSRAPPFPGQKSLRSSCATSPRSTSLLCRSPCRASVGHLVPEGKGISGENPARPLNFKNIRIC